MSEETEEKKAKRRERVFMMTLGRARSKQRRAQAMIDALGAVMKEAEQGLRLVSPKARERCSFSVREVIEGERVEYHLVEGDQPELEPEEPAGDEVVDLPGIG